MDELIAKHGGQSLLPRGEGDAGGSEMFNNFDKWEDLLFEKLAEVNSLVRSVCLVIDIYSPLRNTKPNPRWMFRASRYRR